MSTSREIDCPACGKETLLVREPRYEGFKKVGDTLRCSGCGHVFDSEAEVPYRHPPALKVFTDDERPRALHVFREGENARLCRYCANYVVNPFMQWCGHHKKEVQATDTCHAFKPKPPEPKPLL